MPSSTKSFRSKNTGQLLAEKEVTVGTDSEMHKKISQALDLDSDSISHKELIEHIKINKIMAADASKNQQIVDGLKKTIDKL